MEKDPRSPLNILKKARRNQFIANFLRKEIQDSKQDIAEAASEGALTTSVEELNYIEDQKEVEAAVKRHIFARVIYSVRNFLWYYPKYLEKFIRSTRPVSYLVIYALVFFLLWQLLQSVTLGSVQAAKLRTSQTNTYIELTVGKPSQLNPLFITNNPIDRDINALVFNKLITIDKSSNIEPELAESWSISSDNRSYVFFLRKDVKWHDGEQFNADDVVFTFETVKKLEEADSYSRALKGVEVTKIDEYVVKCKLPGVNALFMENISFPIVPEHVLKDIPTRKLEFSSFSSSPVGTGPYKLMGYDKVDANLTRNDDYFKRKPKIKNIRFRFLENNEQARTFFQLGLGHSLGQATAQDYDYFENNKTAKVYTKSLIKRSRVIYFNMRDKESPIYETTFRQALSSAIDRKKVILAFVGEQGTESTGPIHEESWAYDKDEKRYRSNKDEARKILDKAGWKIADGETFRKRGDKEAKVDLTYFDTPAIKQLATAVKLEWESVGVQVNLQPKTYQQLSEEVIQLRQFEAMLYEIETTIDPDSYNFWHSSNVDGSGLNISGYIYDRIDILTERARRTLDRKARIEDYELLQRYLLRDVPMIYLYHPSYFFVTHSSVNGPDLEKVAVPSERFWNVEKWEIR